MVTTFLFIAFTASINEPQSMGGPMNLSPSSEVWFFIVLVIDAILLAVTYGGIKLSRLSKRAAGVLSFLIGIVILVVGVRNQIRSPSPDGINDTNLMPVPTFLHYAVYCLVGVFLLGGAWLMIVPAKLAGELSSTDEPGSQQNLGADSP
jgi:hypothetical protein